MSIDEAARAYFIEMRSLTVDAEGREVLVGLTHDETEEYFLLTERWMRRHTNVDQRDQDNNRYLELHDKHEPARLQVLLAEVQKRVDRPTSH